MSSSGEQSIKEGQRPGPVEYWYFYNVLYRDFRAWSKMVRGRPWARPAARAADWPGLQPRAGPCAIAARPFARPARPARQGASAHTYAQNPLGTETYEKNQQLSGTIFYSID
jgi:hypothetical protein